MNLGDLPGIAHAAQALDEIVERVAVLGEDDELLADELRIGEHLAELVELRLGPHRRRPSAQGRGASARPFTLDNQVGQRGGDNAGQEVFFGNFAFLAAVHRAFFVGRLAVQNVVVLGHAALKDDDLFLGKLALLHLRGSGRSSFSMRRSKDRSRAYVELAKRRCKTLMAKRAAERLSSLARL